MKATQLTHIVLAVALVALSASTALAQDPDARRNAQQSKPKKVEIAPSFAWRLTEPLGLHLPAEIDTATLDYHTRFVPSLPSIAWATTGNYGAPGQNQIFMERTASSDFFLEDATQHWLPSTAKQLFYNTRIPMTQLSYTTGGDKRSNQDRTSAIFSGNINRRAQAGAWLDYIYSKGSYDYQAMKNFAWGAFGSYIGDRYEMQFFLQNYNYLTKESGGITDDLYITDPAQVQGGETKVDNKSIPTHLTDAHSRVNGLHLYLNQSYNVGFYRYRRDSVTDTIISKTYVPVTRFIWTADWRNAKHRFLNANATQDREFFDNTYLSLTGTDEDTRYMRLRNTVGVSMLEGFNKHVKFGFSVFATHELRRYTQVTDTVTGRADTPEGLTPLPAEFSPKHTQNLLWLGGQLTKTQGSLLRYYATARFGLLGDAAGEIDVDGNITTRIPVKSDTIAVSARGYFRNSAPQYLLNNFVSNHFAWHNDFSKQQRLRLGGQIDLPWFNTSASVDYETLKNYIYFGPDATPVQHSDAVHVLSASLATKLAFGIFHWDNSLTYQTTSNSEVLPLPAFSIFSNMYLKFRVARVLLVQFGVDCNYYTSYYAPAYNPATMTFHTQNEQKCGNFAIADVYANFRLKKARFFVMYTHANKGLFGGKNYFSTPHYPLNPARFQLGVCVDFVN